MNKKIFSLLVAVLIVCLMVTPLVMAKPGTDKSNPKFLDYILHVEFASASDDYPSEWRVNPPSLMDDLGDPPFDLGAIPEDARVLFVKNRIWELALPIGDRYVQIDNVEIPLVGGDFYCLYDVNWIYGAGGFGIYKLQTTIVLDSAEYSGNLEITSIEKTIVDGLTMIGKGTFVAHGVINGQKVQVSGERLVEIDLTFTEPPTMEETGTLQFLGN